MAAQVYANLVTERAHPGKHCNLMLWLYEQRSSVVSAASGRGPYYNFPKLHCSNWSEAVQEHDKIVTRDKVSGVLNCTDAWSNLFRNHLNIVIPIQVVVSFFPATWMIDIRLLSIKGKITERWLVEREGIFFFITSTLKSLAILAIWLALSSVIYS